jgi:hypothetical protein
MGKNQDPGSGINIPDPQHWIPVPNYVRRQTIFPCNVTVPYLLYLIYLAIYDNYTLVVIAVVSINVEA